MSDEVEKRSELLTYNKAQALPMASRERFDRESRRRAAAKPDDHVILDQLHRGLGGGTLESVPISTG